MQGCRDGGCRRRLYGAALSLRSLFCQPSATDQQSASQPCTDLIPLSLSLSLYFCLLLSRSPFLPEALAVPMSPSYANCLSCYQRCMSVWQPLCLPFCLLLCMPVSLPVRLSIIPPVLLSVCFCVCVSVCVHGCLPVHLPVCLPALSQANTSLPESSQAVSGSANLPDYLPVYSSSVCVSICLPACLSACLPVCPSICLLSVCLSSLRCHVINFREVSRIKPNSHVLIFLSLTLHDVFTICQHTETKLCGLTTGKIFIFDCEATGKSPQKRLQYLLNHFLYKSCIHTMNTTLPFHNKEQVFWDQTLHSMSQGMMHHNL